MCWLFIDGTRGRLLNQDSHPGAVLGRLLAMVAAPPGSSPSSTERVKMPGRSVLALALCLLMPCSGQQQQLEEAVRIMDSTPVIDG